MSQIISESGPGLKSEATEQEHTAMAAMSEYIILFIISSMLQTVL